MSNIFDFLNQYKVKESAAVSTFLNALDKQLAMIEKGEFNNRSWAKASGSGFSVKFGKLEDGYRFENKTELLTAFKRVRDAALGDEAFIAAIEKAYGAPVEKPKRGRRTKAEIEAAKAAETP